MERIIAGWYGIRYSPGPRNAPLYAFNQKDNPTDDDDKTLRLSRPDGVLEGLGHLGIALVDMLSTWITPVGDFVFVLADGGDAHVPHGPVFLDELGHEGVRWPDSNHVDLDQDLAAGLVAGADADGGDAQSVGDLSRNVRRDTFQNDGKRPGILDGLCVFQQVHGLVQGVSLDAKATERVLPLRCEADVCDQGDTRGGDLLDGRCHLGSAFELDTLHPALLDHANGTFQRLLGTDFVGTHGKIADRKRSVDGPADGSSRHDHLVESDLGRVGHAERDHGERITDQDHIHSSFLGHQGRGEVVGRQHGYGRVFGVHFL